MPFAQLCGIVPLLVCNANFASLSVIYYTPIGGNIHNADNT